MRAISATLAQNLGNGATGATISLDAHLVEPGAINHEIDKELTKLVPGDVSLKIEDHDGSIWEWIQAQIQSPGALYRPILTLSVGGMQRFSGVIDPSTMTRNEKTREIDLTAQDWSVQLSEHGLETWTRALPKAPSSRPGETRVCGAEVQHEGNYYSNPVIDGDILYAGGEWLHVGDLVTWDGAPGKQFKALQVHEFVPPLGATGEAIPDVRWRITLGKEWGQVIQDAYGAHLYGWSGGPNRLNITRPALANLDSREYYVVTETVPASPSPEVYQIKLDTVDGIVPGDQLSVLHSAKSATWTVLQVDAAALRIYTRESVSDLPSGSYIFFTSDCAKQVVFEDARVALAKAVPLPFHVDPSRLQMPTLPVPVLIWLPLRPLAGADLTSLRAMDAQLSSLRVFGSGTLAWDGTPEAGWQSLTTTDAARGTHWSDQRTIPPTSLMPEAWTGGTPAALVFDYIQSRRIVFPQDPTSQNVIINAWDGTAWGADISAPPLTIAVTAASVLPGTPGMVLARKNGDLCAGMLPSTEWIQLSTADQPVDAREATIRTTPWGAYLVGKKGYGRITYQPLVPGRGSTLLLAWVSLLASDGGEIYPETFAGLDETQCTVLARYEAMDKDGKKVIETHALLLAADPVTTNASASILWDEKILDGAPITYGAMRDPSQPNRVIGHCGGQLFQISRKLPECYAIERFTPSAMKSAELIEHICQLLQCCAVPDASGTLHIISRASTEEVRDIQVDRVEIEETRAWENFFSTVTVSGEAESTATALAPIAGGQSLEISDHPLVWTKSGCLGMAASYAQWFGVPRRMQKETWFWTDPDSPAPWESLPPLARVRVNGDPTVWRVMGMDDRGHTREGQAQVILLEESFGTANQKMSVTITSPL